MMLKQKDWCNIVVLRHAEDVCLCLHFKSYQVAQVHKNDQDDVLKPHNKPIYMTKMVKMCSSSPKNSYNSRK